MTKNTIVLSIIAIFCLAIFTACGRRSPSETSEHSTQIADAQNRNITTPPMSSTLTDILNNALIRREDITRPSKADLIPLTTGREVTMSEHDIAYYRLSFFNRYTSPDQLPYDTNVPLVNYDVDLFFSSLSSLYAQYIYFGGDEVFLPIRDHIMYTIEQRTHWEPYELEELLYESLSPVIVDSVFHLGNRRFRGGMEILQYNRQFSRSENGFFCTEHELYVYELVLQCIPDLYINIQDSFRFSMDESGEIFFYTLVIALPAPANEFPVYYLQIVYEDGTYEIVPLDMLASIRSRGDRRPISNFYPPSFEVMQGIPVVAIEIFGLLSLDDTLFGATLIPQSSRSARQFLDIAEQLRDEPVFILDLRNNGGGYGLLADQWLHQLTGYIIPPNFNNLAISSYNDHVEWFIETAGQYHPIPTFFDENHTTLILPPCEVIANDQLIIVLVDRFTASAGERMVDFAFSMENVLVIGQNTGGAYISGNGRINSALPWSNIPFGFSFDMRVPPEGHFQEGIGFAPDIWVMGDALTAALNMLNHHIED